MNINIKTFFIYILASILFLVSLNIYLILNLYNTSNNLRQLQHDKFAMTKTANYLRQSSEDLTKFANKYVITGKFKYKQNYLKIIAMREGKIKRPLDYSSTYWNLSKESREKLYPLTKKLSLKQEISNLPYNKYELSLLKQSKSSSDSLTLLELEAFNALSGLFQNVQGKYLIKGLPNKSLALSLMNSPNYDNRKENIMMPVNKLLTHLKIRTQKSINEFYKDINSSFKIAIIIFIIEIILFIIATILIIKKILTPISTLKQCISHFEINESHKHKHANINNSDFYNDEIGIMAKTIFQMREKYSNNFQEIKKQSLTDSLTRIGNRRFFFEVSDKMLKLSKRNKTTLSVLILDIDFFKKVNDTHGHLVGDEVLKFLVDNVNKVLRTSDIFSRFGGEEFIALLPRTDTAGSILVAEKIRKHIETSTYISKNNTPINITVSIGVSEYIKKDSNINSIILRADKVLYLAKKNGRNRIEYS